MRGVLVTCTFYCEASGQSILINAQDTNHLSESIPDLIKYTNQFSKKKRILTKRHKTNLPMQYLERTSHISVRIFMPPLVNSPLLS
jgi:hypothetical protein